MRLTGISSIVLSLALIGGASALAQDNPPPHKGMGMGMGMQGNCMHGAQGDCMHGMHQMSATVDAVDHASGLVDVTAGGMKLKLHYPPASLEGVNAGDTITLHLGFTK